MNVVEATTISITQHAFVLPIAEALRAHGNDVALVCSDEKRDEGSSFVDQLRSRGFEVFEIPMSRRISPLRDLLATFRLYRFLKSRRIDLLHVQTAKAGMIGRIAARLAAVPVVVYTAHAFAFHDYLPWWRKHLYATLERLASHLCDVIVVDSEAVKRRGVEFKLAPSKIRVIPMGIDTDRFSPMRRNELRDSTRRALDIPNEAPVIGLAARFVPDKGLETFVDAAARIALRRQDALFLMVGDGPLRRDIERRISDYGLARTFRLPGMQSEVEAYYAAMDVFMLPTLREGFGVAFCEAMSMQIPVVATRIAPLTDVVTDALTGFLADAGDAEGFAAAAERLIVSPALRATMGQAGRLRVVEHFSVQRMVREHELLFDSLTSGRDHG